MAKVQWLLIGIVGLAIAFVARETRTRKGGGHGFQVAERSLELTAPLRSQFGADHGCFLTVAVGQAALFHLALEVRKPDGTAAAARRYTVML